VVAETGKDIKERSTPSSPPTNSASSNRPSASWSGRRAPLP